ncbi:hypothetical protein ACFVXE_39095, partial [Streptomyces sp. NPDC058231]
DVVSFGSTFVEPRMTCLVERLVPDELWALFRRVVPPTPLRRPQGGGRRRASDFSNSLVGQNALLRHPGTGLEA